MNSKYFTLLKEWCDALLTLQLDMPLKELSGGIICPACHMIHGRCADAIYPLLSVAEVTGEQKYIRAAQKLFNWTENNMSCENGAVKNDMQLPWQGITVFYATTLAEALLYHGHLLDAAIKERWAARLEKALSFLIPFIDTINTAINYRAAMCGLLALAAKLFQKEVYRKQAKFYADTMYPFLDQSGLLFGEAKQKVPVSAKGCLPVDIGYNVEESLPSLILYAKECNDQKMQQILNKVLETHLDFALPDGGWDNSFGIRSIKWTYWGSRTSDGCQTAFPDMADIDPRLGEMAERNFELYRRCTQNGLLYGGPMYCTANEPPCVHHTFCHAKAVAHLVDTNFTPPQSVALPFDFGNKIKYYPLMQVYLLRRGGFRATISANDAYHGANDYSSGGALTLLWHDSTGPIFAASAPDYRLTEPTNMQTLRSNCCLCQTPRLEYTENNITYTNIRDKNAVINQEDPFTFTARGQFTDKEDNVSCGYTITYHFEENDLTITCTAEKDCALWLPLIASSKETVLPDSTTVTVKKAQATISVSAPEFCLKPAELRTFNPIGGFQTYPAVIRIPKDLTCRITLTVTPFINI